MNKIIRLCCLIVVGLTLLGYSLLLMRAQSVVEDYLQESLQEKFRVKSIALKWPWPTIILSHFSYGQWFQADYVEVSFDPMAVLIKRAKPANVVNHIKIQQGRFYKYNNAGQKEFVFVIHSFEADRSLWSTSEQKTFVQLSGSVDDIAWWPPRDEISIQGWVDWSSRALDVEAIGVNGDATAHRFLKASARAQDNVLDVQGVLNIRSLDALSVISYNSNQTQETSSFMDGAFVEVNFNLTTQFDQPRLDDVVFDGKIVVEK